MIVYDSVRIRASYLLFLVYISSNISLTQPAYLMNLENAARVNDSIIEFDVNLKSTAADFILTSYQCVFTFNSEIINGGNPAFSFVPGTSQLTNQPALSIGIISGENQFKLTFASLAGMDSISGVQKRVGRFKLYNSVPFSGSGFSLQWVFSGIVNSILTGDYFINITNPAYHNNLNIAWDIIPPSLQSAALEDSTNLLLEFSEPLDTVNVRLLSNYSISNGANVLSVIPLSPFNKIRLFTTAHALSTTYNITVQNLKDLSGNVVSGSSNSLSYSLGNFLALRLKILLQGAYRNGVMSTSLNGYHFIPERQPFNTSPWNYGGTEQISTVTNNIVDWILIELRTEARSSTAFAWRAALLKNDGFAQDVDGTDFIKFIGSPGAYYAVVRHRNHLGIMSANKINLSDTVSFYDFTSSLNSAYGTNALAQIGENTFGLFSGDGNGNGAINNPDLNTVWKKENGKMGYKAGDFDLNGGVNIVDKNLYWQLNNGKVTNIP